MGCTHDDALLFYIFNEKDESIHLRRTGSNHTNPRSLITTTAAADL